MFSFFKREKSKELPAIMVFTSKVQLYKWLIADAVQSPSTIFYFFEETGNELRALLDAAGAEEIKLLNWKGADKKMISGNVYVAELYPLSGPYTNLINGLQQNSKTSVQTLSHLDSPIFTKMGGENLKALVARLGVKADESISHSMVTRAISNLQSKLDQKVATEREANSIEDWFRINLGD
ncbi:hypothetical protein [uncultured Imperialibacter sp.]|uniref:hypothetical protein n=1 Tax=uncultured Imperialibacter sp. TaxID=1672639 RepID=UPI0030D754D0|tara:strand:- start:2382 stop:2924 length:543 start_codon:yes stop_codon:yes gene_type:complete